MKLLTDWKQIIRKAWSIRLMILAGALSAVEAILPFFSDLLPRGLFAGLSGLTIMAAFVTRLLAQKDLHDGD